MPFVKLGNGKAWQQPSQDKRLERIYGALEAAGCEQGSGEDWQCPAHEDKKASLGIARGTEGRILLNCQKGCAVGAILKALGLPRSVISPDSVPVADYVYTDAENNRLYRVVRYKVGVDGKSFTQEKWSEERHSWLSGKSVMAGVPMVLYNLPRVVAAAESASIIWFFEGEKDADQFRSRTRDKWAATSAPRGAKNWMDEYADSLVGARRINIVVDRDADGYRHALSVADSCGKRGIPYRLYIPAVEEPKADYSDHVAAGYKLTDLLQVDRAEMKEMLATAKALHPEDDGEIPGTDADAARALFARHGANTRWIDTGGNRGHWIVWDKDKWVADSGGICVRRVHDLGEEYLPRAQKDYSQAVALQAGVGVAGDTLRAVKGMKNTTRIKTILEQFKTISPDMTISEESLDSDRELLGVANGAVYLGPYPSLASPERARASFLTRSTGVAARLDPDGRVDRAALAPEGIAIWQAYLDMFIPDPDLAEFLGRVVGYSLLGGNPSGLLFCLIGPPHTGKTTFANALSWALGDYCAPLNFSAFHGDMSNKPREDIADIVSARIAIAPELSSAWELHSDQIKRLTGSDKISYNRKYEKQVRRYPDFTAFLASNGNPRIRGADQALKDRICCIPFRHASPNGKDDTAEKLRRMDAREAVLAWALEGFERYRGTGLRPEKWPESVRKFTRSVVSRLDDIDNFISDELRVDPKRDDWRIPTKDVYPRYRAWCEETNTRPTGQHQFGESLTSKGIVLRGKWYDGRMVKCRIGVQWRA